MVKVTIFLSFFEKYTAKPMLKKSDFLIHITTAGWKIVFWVICQQAQLLDAGDVLKTMKIILLVSNLFISTYN